MRASTLTPFLALAASSVSAQFLNQTAPFNLVLLSSNSTINGSALGACHEGAAIEGLCLGFASPFTLNYTASTNPTPTIGTYGYLTYELRGGNFNLSSPMSLIYNPTSNVAIPLFEPSNSGTEVAFLGDRLNIPGWIDDTVYPVSEVPKAYFRWL